MGSATIAAIDWPSVRDEAVTLLQRLIQFETVNPPGNEAACAQFLADFLRRHGIESMILMAAPERANLIARVGGSGDGRPLLLFPHFDVVPVERDKWTQEPFGGAVVEGYLYGRGALDMKQMIAMGALALVLMRRHNVTPKRDLILAVVADEETGGDFGAKWLVDNHREKIDAEYCLNEVGGFSVQIAGKKLYPIEVAEKGGAGLALTARGDPGHASVPNPDSAVARLARAIDKLTRTPLPHRKTAASVAMVQTLASLVPYPANVGIKALVNKRLAGPALRGIALTQPGVARELSASFRNTVTPTMLQAGVKRNVIPSEAVAQIDGRVLPGVTREEFLAEVRAALGSHADHVEVTNDRFFSGVAWRFDTPLFERLGETIKRHDPEAVPTPWLNPATTDSRFLAPLGITCYGWIPTPMAPTESFARLFHGHDERIAVESLLFGVKAMYDLLSTF